MNIDQLTKKTSSSYSFLRNLCYDNNPPFHKNDCTIIDKANQQPDLRIIESLYIHQIKLTINTDQSVKPQYIF